METSININESNQSNAPKEVSIKLPYSISNVVFVEKIFSWILIIISLSIVINKLSSNGPNKEESFIAMLPVFLPLIFYVILNSTIWKWALGGKVISTLITYILYIPFVLIFLVSLKNSASTIFPSFSTSSAGGWGTLFAFIIFACLPTFCVVINLFEQGLIDFIKLNGMCPACKNWEFGAIKKPCKKQCINCNSILDFVRND